MFKKFCFVMVFFMMFIVTGCDQTSYTEFSAVALDDFQYAPHFSKSTSTHGYLIFEISSEKEFNKTKGFLLETLGKYFTNPQNISLHKQDMKDMVGVQIDMPILRTMDDDAATLYYIYTDETLYFKISPQKLAQLNYEMKEAMGHGLNDVRELNIMLSIHNDIQAPIKYTIPDIFVNNIPTYAGMYELPIDEKIDLTLTNFQVERALADPIMLIKL